MSIQHQQYEFGITLQIFPNLLIIRYTEATIEVPLQRSQITSSALNGYSYL